MPRFSTALGLAIALGLCASHADATQTIVTGLFQVTITPDTNLSDLYLLYDSGDHEEAVSLGPGSAPAGVTTNFYLPFTLPSCSHLIILASPQCSSYVGVVAVNTDETPNGVAVGVDPGQATILFNLPFSDPNCSAGAFPGFCYFADPDSPTAEAALVGGLEDPNNPNTYSQGLNGSQVASAFASAAEPQLALFNTLTYTATLSLVTFSNGQSDGNASLDFLIGTPEPATVGLLAAGLLLFGYRRLTSRS